VDYKTFKIVILTDLENQSQTGVTVLNLKLKKIYFTNKAGKIF